MEWSFRFPNARVQHLPIINSDHSPLLISNNPQTRFDGGKKFRFNYIWTTHKDFNRCVWQAWNSEKELDENITATAASLSSWNIHVFGNVFYRKKRLLARIKGIQRSLMQHARHDLLRLDRKLRKELEDTLHQEELIWFQRSKEDWIKSGDRNTRYYHLATSVKNKNGKIKELITENDTRITDEQLLRTHIQNHFVNFFSDFRTVSSRTAIYGRFPVLNENEWQMVNQPFLPEEVKEALFDMDPYKAPGPDYFTAGFYQRV